MGGTKMAKMILMMSEPVKGMLTDVFVQRRLKMSGCEVEVDGG
jgi:hypothetical protein